MKLEKMILSENKIDLGYRTLSENGLANVINKNFDFAKISEDFLDVVVDIYPTEYGEFCQVTILMKRPFKREVADEIGKIKQDITKLISSLLHDKFKGRISTSTSTLEVYSRHLVYYNQMKNKGTDGDIQENIERIVEIMENSKITKSKLSSIQKVLDNLKNTEESICDFVINQDEEDEIIGVYIVFKSSWVDNLETSPDFVIRRYRQGIREEIKKWTGQDVYVGSYSKECK